MNVKNIEVHFENGESKILEKGFAVNLNGDQLDAFFTEVNAMEMLSVLYELTYEMTHIIKHNEISDGATGTLLEE